MRKFLIVLLIGKQGLGTADQGQAALRLSCTDDARFIEATYQRAVRKTAASRNTPKKELW